MEKSTIYTGSASDSANSANSFSADGQAGNSATSGVQKRVESAGAALHSTIDKVVDPALNAVNRLSSAAHESVDKLADSASQTAERVSTQTQRLTEAPARALACSTAWVQEKPWEAVGAALAFGFIVGRLTSR
ncbi:MAG: hypothetical protein V4772_07690 [Pseudomonadota bacterium]